MELKIKSKHDPSVIVIVLSVIIVLLMAVALSEFNIISSEVLPWVLVYVLLGSNILICMMNQNSKTICLFSVLLLILLAGTAYSVNHSNTDIEAYERLYNQLQSGMNITSLSYASDVGYRFLMQCAIWFGLSFNGFTTLVSVISFLLIYSSIKKITNKFSLVIACYAIMTFTYDVYQLRFLLGYAIVIYAFRYYLFEEYYNIWKYTIIVLIGSLIHFSMIFYLILLIKSLGDIVIKYYIFILAFAVGAILFTYALGINLFRLLSINWFGRYTYGQISGVRISIITAMYIVFIVLYMVYVTKQIRIEFPAEIHTRLFLINILCALICPFLSITLEFERFLRPILLIDYAFVSQDGNLTKNKKMLYSTMWIIICLIRASVMTTLSDFVISNNYLMDFLFGGM